MGVTKIRQTALDPIESGRETLHSLRTHAAKGIANEAKESGKTFLQQLLGLNLSSDSQPTHADQAPTEKPQVDNGVIEVFNFLTHRQLTSEKPKAHAEKAPRAEAHMNYNRDIMRNSEKASKGEMREMNQNIQQIKIELAKLVSSSQVLKMEFTDIGVGTATPTVGKYQLNFFEWMLTVIRSARQKVEDSGAWLGTVKGKGAKKDYWGMFKKHGTTFGQSGERTAATSAQ